MEKFSLKHTVLYAKNWYERKSLWNDLVTTLEMDGYLGTFIGDTEEQIKNRVGYIIIGQFERLQYKGRANSLQTFYESIKPHNCWKYGYYTKGYKFLRSQNEIDESPEYDYNEAVVRYCLSYFAQLSREEWDVCRPDYSNLQKPKDVTDEKIKKMFAYVK